VGGWLFGEEGLRLTMRLCRSRAITAVPVGGLRERGWVAPDDAPLQEPRDHGSACWRLRERGWVAPDDAPLQEPRDHGGACGGSMSAAGAVA
jgi:hypothetical protein